MTCINHWFLLRVSDIDDVKQNGTKAKNNTSSKFYVQCKDSDQNNVFYYTCAWYKKQKPYYFWPFGGYMLLIASGSCVSKYAANSTNYANNQRRTDESGLPLSRKSIGVN